MAQISLHQFPPLPGTLSMSPFCCKVHMALRLRGLEYQTHNTFFPKRLTPTAQLPFLEWDGTGFTDSSAIIRLIDARAPSASPFVPLDPQLAADAHLLEDWADESLYWYGGYAKFIDDDGWSRLRGPFTASLPVPLRLLAPSVARRRIRGLLRAQGLLRRSGPEMVRDEFARHLDALEVKTSGRRYLVGETPSVADLAVVSMLAQLTVGLTPRFGDAIAQRPALSAYLVRLREESRTVPA